MNHASRPATAPIPVLAAALLLFGAAGCTTGSSPTATASVGSAGTGRTVNLDFTLPAVEGGSVDLKQFDGKIRVVDFWATWCPPCRKAIPHFNELHRKYKDKGVVVVGVSVDESPRHVTAFYDEVRIEYPSVMSTERAEQAFGGVVGLPTTFVLDRDGRIATSYVGDTDPATVERDVQALLAN